jgi:hypothetical protein
MEWRIVRSLAEQNCAVSNTGDAAVFKTVFPNNGNIENCDTPHRYATGYSAKDTVDRLKYGEEQEELQEDQEKLRRKKAYISKYGEYYGSLISEAKVDVGMSRAMVNEIWNKSFFNISISVHNGLSIEMWEFDQEKMNMEIIKEGMRRENGVEEALMMLFATTMALEFDKSSVPRLLIFTNDKLTDIYR